MQPDLINLSTVILPQDGTLLREAIRSTYLQEDSYFSQYDNTTLFDDLFRHRNYVVAVCPSRFQQAGAGIAQPQHLPH